MADIPRFFVMVFARTVANRVRVVAVIKAISERHATSLASHFTGAEEGAIALSRLINSCQEGQDARVVSWFGGAAPESSNVWAVGGCRAARAC
jgi:hypothetical protein